jgi:hypothetical protein
MTAGLSKAMNAWSGGWGFDSSASRFSATGGMTTVETFSSLGFFDPG